MWKVLKPSSIAPSFPLTHFSSSLPKATQGARLAECCLKKFSLHSWQILTLALLSSRNYIEGSRETASKTMNGQQMNRQTDEQWTEEAVTGAER
jgi:hypothetical protein